MKNIILFASGSGSNAQRIMNHFKNNPGAGVAAVFTNNAMAGVIEKAQAYHVPAVVFTRDDLNSGRVLEQVREFNPHLIVLAGFLWKFPSDIIAAYPEKIVNIHPALLPKYGGKGMYGINVHRAVHENKEAESGITIHYVNANYDEGNIIFQQAVAVDDCATPEEVAARVLELEHRYFSEVIEKLLKEDF
ncbi:phosphoribosylglycinamide formyltransferase [Flavobacterium cyanobacteriorum]|uniref:phosphoribosylglycinamide formyltransferase 1 n=1 Tax=Flavobacterium cyanobacteriorum TaxID=2022802 RepID=A0A255ZA38_9FLAO|nr:phosphoribosylglycinamide formyltransferase [Flavobacterium cyanobacteriorum]OYQ38338.1 phosphoribosylglycinamide formyltransferase [Flavobacterium cyanobacteriorum]